MNGGRLLCRALGDAGITTVVGIPGTDNTLFFQYLKDEGLRLIVPTNEQFAPMIADGYARMMRKPAAVASIPGPGALLLLSGLMEANGSSVPMLVLVTDIPEAYRNKRKGYLHEVHSLERYFSEFSLGHIVRSAKEFPKLLREIKWALETARPRPRTLVIPSDLYSEEVEFFTDEEETAPHLRQPSVKDIFLAAHALHRSRKPMIFAGRGVWCSDAMHELRLIAEKLGAPVFTSVNGKGVLSDMHPLSFGQFIGEPEIMALAEESDCLLAVGIRWSDRSTGRWSLPFPKNIIEINVSGEQSLGYPAQLIMSDARGGLRELLRAVSEYASEPEWALRFTAAKDAIMSRLQKKFPLETLMLKQIAGAVNESNAILVNDSCIAGYWTRRYLKVNQPGAFLWPMGSGTIGWGIPAALGVRAALNEAGEHKRPVIALVGDGGLRFSLSELATIQSAKLPITIVLFDDNAYGVIRAFEEERHGRSTEATLLVNPEYRKLAASFGLRYRHVSSPQTLGRALSQTRAWQHETGTLIHYPVAFRKPDRI